MNTQFQRASGWRLIVRLLWYGLAACIVLTAVGLTALRIGVSVAPEYRAFIETRISDVLGQPLTLSRFRIEWRGLAPQLTLNDIRVGEGSRLSVRELRMDLNLGRSLRLREPVFTRLELVGMELTVERERSGRFRLDGVENGRTPDSAHEVVNELLANLKHRSVRNLRLSDSRIRLLDKKSHHTRLLEEIDLLLREIPEGGWQLAGRARLPDKWGRELAFNIEWRRDGARPLREGVIELFAEARGLRPDAMDDLIGESDGQVVPVDVAGDLRLWGTLQGGLPEWGKHVPDARHRGNITVLGEHGEVRVSRLFRGPLPFERLAAEAHWIMDEDGWRLNVREAAADNEDGRVLFRGTVARRPQQPLFMNLRANLRGKPGNVTSASRYMPAGIMREKLVTWLDRSLVSGTASQADIIFFGHTDDFPFTEGRGHFEVRADISDAALDYLPDWPGLTGVDGRLHFLADSIRITADVGEVGGARLLNAEAVIPHFGQPLTITGNVHGSGESLLGFLRDMPLTSNALERTVSAVRLDGDHVLSLALNVPFRGRPVGVEGQVELKDARFRVPDRDFSIESLNGTVSFDRRGVRASGVRGRFHGAPLVLSAETTGDASTGALIRVHADASQIPLAALHQSVPGTDFLTGAGNLTVIADLPGFTGNQAAEYPVKLEFRSDLVGVENSMPAPLGKASGEDLPLSVEFGVGEQVGPIRIQYGKQASLLLALAEQGNGLERLNVHLGGGAGVSLPRQAGIALTGTTAVLDVDGWRAWSASGGRGESADRNAMSLRRLDFEADSLRLGGWDFAGVKVKGQRDGDQDWNLTLSGPTAAGIMQIPLDNSRGRALRLNLRHLRLDSLPGFDTGTDAGTSRFLIGPSTIPADVPAIEADVDKLILMDQELGRLRMRSGPDEVGDYQFREFTLKGAAHELDISGSWRVPEGTNLWFSLRSEDVGLMLGTWGHPDAMQGGRGRVRGSLAWPGGPRDFTAEALQGSMHLELRNGQLVQLEPGAGRLFGLVSVAMLPRRLLLNFSDVVEEGFSFDRLEASFALADGRARPRTLYMDGPAARISAEGDIDLVARTYDQTVTVLPKASATLPLIGGLLGGPPAAAALFVAQQLFSRDVDGVASMKYQLTGPWESPEINRIGPSAATTISPAEPDGGRTSP